MESKRGDGLLSACEVTLVHYEDMVFPTDVAKLGVRHGMLGAVNKLHSGFRAYEAAKNSEAVVSKCAMMSRIATKISSDEGAGTLERVTGEEDKYENIDIQGLKGGGGINWIWVFNQQNWCSSLQPPFWNDRKSLVLGAGQRFERRRRNVLYLVWSIQSNHVTFTFLEDEKGEEITRV